MSCCLMDAAKKLFFFLDCSHCTPLGCDLQLGKEENDHNGTQWTFCTRLLCLAKVSLKKWWHLSANSLLLRIVEKRELSLMFAPLHHSSQWTLSCDQYPTILRAFRVVSCNPSSFLYFLLPRSHQQSIDRWSALDCTISSTHGRSRVAAQIVRSWADSFLLPSSFNLVAAIFHFRNDKPIDAVAAVTTTVGFPFRLLI